MKVTLGWIAAAALAGSAVVDGFSTATTPRRNRQTSNVIVSASAAAGAPLQPYPHVSAVDVESMTMMNMAESLLSNDDEINPDNREALVNYLQSKSAVLEARSRTMRELARQLQQQTKMTKLTTSKAIDHPDMNEDVQSLMQSIGQYISLEKQQFEAAAPSKSKRAAASYVH